MFIAETTSTATNPGIALALARTCASAYPVFDYEPQLWSDAASWSFRAKRLKDRYGKRGAMPKAWDEIPLDFLATLPREVLRQCEEHRRLGDERKAIRLAYCRRLARVYQCPECGRPAKKASDCKNRTCLDCAKRNFDSLFTRYLQVDLLIPAAVRSLPGWTWHVLDFSFRHDGNWPEQWELRAMVGIIRRVTQRAVEEACHEWYRARQGCRLRLDEGGNPMMNYDGWPIAGAPDGEARALAGWVPVFFPEHMAPDNNARREGTRGAKKKVPARWELRFGYELIRVTEFGFDNTNAHFHCAYFGPLLDYWYSRDAKKDGRLVCGGRLVEIFKEESRRPRDVEDPSRGGLGVESYTVFFEPAKKGFRSVLSHALKYTKKIPASTPEGLAQLEKVLGGTRRVTLLEAHYGVSLKPKPTKPKCPKCGTPMRRLDGVGLVPLSEVWDLPDVIEEYPIEEGLREPSADEFLDVVMRGP